MQPGVPIGTCASLPSVSAETLEEGHFHTYGPCGILMIDMRGNRIRPTGRLRDGEPPLLSFHQRRMIEAAFATPGLSCMLVAAEIPFVGASIEKCNDPKVLKQTPFLADHWAHCPSELTWLLDQCFAFKAGFEGREVLLLACATNLYVVDSWRYAARPSTSSLSSWFTDQST